MTRFAALHLTLSVAALLVSFEGVSQARTTAEPLAGREAPAAESPRAPGNVPDAAQMAARPTRVETGIARIRICHISRHPRDGVPATEHACPLVVAEADVASPAVVATPN
ncbi:MAG TPA: hypothetical protein VEJ87_04085 [Acidimicrobiales bacterium]|nr:hypothetical protein [Acidimicrobiales bacterium]